MSSLFATNDVHTQERANRNAIAARYALPLYDVDDADAVTVEARKAGGPLGTSLTTMFTAVGTVAQIHTITLVNSGAPHVVSLYLIEPGASTASVARQIFADTLAPGEVLTITVPYYLAASGSLRGITDATSSVYYSVNALDYDAQPAGLRLKVIEGAALTTGGATLYTCPGDVTHAIVLAATVCNTTAANAVGQIYESATFLFSLTLAPKESAWIEPHHLLIPTEAIGGLSDTSSAVGCRLTILEVE